MDLREQARLAYRLTLVVAGEDRYPAVARAASPNRAMAASGASP